MANKDLLNGEQLNDLNSSYGMFDESVEEHVNRVAEGDIGIQEISKVRTLTDEEIEDAKGSFSPESITNKYPADLEVAGPLFRYQPEFDEDGQQVFDESTGVKVPVYQKDAYGKNVIKSSAKWDENIEYDIRRGLESYDSAAAAKETNEVVNEKTIIEDEKIIALADLILQEAIDAKAEDTIIVQFEHFGLVRHFDGNSFINQRLLYKSAVDPVITILKKKAGLRISKENARKEQTNGQIKVGGVNFRVAADSSEYGMFIVMRQQAVAFDSLDDLNIPDSIKAEVRRAVAGKDGLTIVGGPPGSGKTTLMTTALVEHQKKTHGSSNILSLEQPIETPTPGIIQKDIDEDYGVTWDGAISAALREKPQIIRVGETSTRPAAQAIVRAANAGIVALTTLHIQSAIEVFETLKSLGVEESDIKNSLKLVIYLNRVPRLCPHCRIESSILQHSDINIWIKRHLNDDRSAAVAKLAFRNPEGCEVCRAKQTNPALYGTIGKIGIYEYLKVNRPMLRIYRKYMDQDAYVLKEKLLHPSTIKWDDPDDPDAQEMTGSEDRSAGLEYYSLERDILDKINSLDIDYETAKYLTNE